MPAKKKMSIALFALAVVLFAIALGAWWYLFFARPNPQLPQANVTVSPSASSAPAAEGNDGALSDISYANERLSVDGATFTVELATSTLAQTRGLSYRTSLGADRGMLFIFPFGSVQTFWMKDMNFPLDMIWISGDKVVGVSENVPPPPAGTPIWQLAVYSSPPNTDKVLEVNAGTVAKYAIKIGDAVTGGPVQ